MIGNFFGLIIIYQVSLLLDKVYQLIKFLLILDIIFALFQVKTNYIMKIISYLLLKNLVFIQNVTGRNLITCVMTYFQSIFQLHSFNLCQRDQVIRLVVGYCCYMICCVIIMILWLYPCLLLIGNFDICLSMKSLFCSFVRLNGLIIGMLFFF